MGSCASADSGAKNEELYRSSSSSGKEKHRHGGSSRRSSRRGSEREEQQQHHNGTASEGTKRVDGAAKRDKGGGTDGSGRRSSRSKEHASSGHGNGNGGGGGGDTGKRERSRSRNDKTTSGESGHSRRNSVDNSPTPHDSHGSDYGSGGGGSDEWQRRAALVASSSAADVRAAEAELDDWQRGMLDIMEEQSIQAYDMDVSAAPGHDGLMGGRRYSNSFLGFSSQSTFGNGVLDSPKVMRRPMTNRLGSHHSSFGPGSDAAKAGFGSSSPIMGGGGGGGGALLSSSGAAATAASASSSSASAAAAALSTPTILVVDEHPSTRQIITKWLTNSRYTEISCATGAQAQEILAPPSPPPASAYAPDSGGTGGGGGGGATAGLHVDVIVCDVNVLVNNGQTLLLDWVINTPGIAGIPVIVLSSNLPSQGLERLLRRGAWDVLHKPLNRAVFLNGLATVFNTRRQKFFIERLRARGDEYKERYLHRARGLAHAAATQAHNNDPAAAAGGGGAIAMSKMVRGISGSLRNLGYAYGPVSPTPSGTTAALPSYLPAAAGPGPSSGGSMPATPILHHSHLHMGSSTASPRTLAPPGAGSAMLGCVPSSPGGGGAGTTAPQPITILLVESDAAIARSLTSWIESPAVHVRLVSTVGEAVALLRESQKNAVMAAATGHSPGSRLALHRSISGGGAALTIQPHAHALASVAAAAQNGNAPAPAAAGAAVPAPAANASGRAAASASAASTTVAQSASTASSPSAGSAPSVSAHAAIEASASASKSASASEGDVVLSRAPSIVDASAAATAAATAAAAAAASSETCSALPGSVPASSDSTASATATATAPVTMSVGASAGAGASAGSWGLRVPSLVSSSSLGVPGSPSPSPSPPPCHFGIELVIVNHDLLIPPELNAELLGGGGGGGAGSGPDGGEDGAFSEEEVEEEEELPPSEPLQRDRTASKGSTLRRGPSPLPGGGGGGAGTARTHVFMSSGLATSQMLVDLSLQPVLGRRRKLPVVVICDAEGPSPVGMALLKHVAVTIFPRPLSRGLVDNKMAILLELIDQNRQGFLLARRAQLYKNMLSQLVGFETDLYAPGGGMGGGGGAGAFASDDGAPGTPGQRHGENRARLLNIEREHRMRSLTASPQGGFGPLSGGGGGGGGSNAGSRRSIFTPNGGGGGGTGSAPGSPKLSPAGSMAVAPSSNLLPPSFLIAPPCDLAAGASSPGQQQQYAALGFSPLPIVRTRSVSPSPTGGESAFGYTLHVGGAGGGGAPSTSSGPSSREGSRAPSPSPSAPAVASSRAMVSHSVREAAAAAASASAPSDDASPNSASAPAARGDRPVLRIRTDAAGSAK